MDTSIQNNLLPNEQILWEGQPQIARGINLKSLPTSILWIIWLAFSLFWTANAFLSARNIYSTNSIGLISAFFGLPFVAVGINMVFIAPMKQRKISRLTYYYVTNKRVIINIDTKSPVLNSVQIEDMQRVQLVQNRDNTGNIIFPLFFGGI